MSILCQRLGRMTSWSKGIARTSAGLTCTFGKDMDQASPEGCPLFQAPRWLARCIVSARMSVQAVSVSPCVRAPVSLMPTLFLVGPACTAHPLGDAVVIQGAGGLGLYAPAIAKDMGAGREDVFISTPKVGVKYW